MRLTKYAHACVTFTDGDRTLLVDPGPSPPAPVTCSPPPTRC